MSIQSNVYGNAIVKALNKQLDYLNDAIKIMLLDSSYTPDFINHVFVSNLLGEVSGMGYTTGGQVLTGKTMVYDAASNTVKLDANDCTWLNATFTCRYAVIYKDSGTPSSSLLIGCVNLGADNVVTSTTFTITWNANGIFNLSSL